VVNAMQRLSVNLIGIFIHKLLQEMLDVIYMLQVIVYRRPFIVLLLYYYHTVIILLL
jgi:hypothetical protein